MMKLLFAVTMGLALPAFASQPITDKSAAAAIITALEPAQKEITGGIRQAKTTEGAGANVRVAFPVRKGPFAYGLDEAHVASNGTLVGYNRKYGVVVILEPTYEKETVSWRCKVIPVSAAPSELCK